MPGPDAQQGRLAWRCRRGMKELDLLLRRYLADCWPAAAESEKARFEAFLELPDPLIAAYLLGNEAAPDPALESLLVALRGGVAPLAARSAATDPPDFQQS